MRFSPVYVHSGALLQGGLPKGSRSPFRRGVPPGIKLKAVVVAVYEIDAPAEARPQLRSLARRTIQVDAITYGHSRYSSLPIPRCQIACGLPVGIHDGPIPRLPRAARIDLTGRTFDPNRSDLNSTDGDHCIVEFLELDPQQPIITGWLSHPRADEGIVISESGIGHRQRLYRADGDPFLLRHHGAFFGIGDDGSFIVDLTRARVGPALNEDGTEPDPPLDGSAGNLRLRLPEASTFNLEINGQTLKLERADGAARLDLGNATVSAAIAEQLKGWWNNTIKGELDARHQQFITHAHNLGAVTPGSPTTPPFPAPAAAPAVPVPLPGASLSGYSDSITSSKLKLPDG